MFSSSDDIYLFCLEILGNFNKSLFGLLLTFSSVNYRLFKILLLSELSGRWIAFFLLYFIELI
jgi:hypothetical protein